MRRGRGKMRRGYRDEEGGGDEERSVFFVIHQK